MAPELQVPLSAVVLPPLRTLLVRTMTRLRAARHELRCAECRVTWKSWAQRLAGIGAGFTPAWAHGRINRVRKLQQSDHNDGFGEAE